jgi:hypothetical protein
MIKKYLLLIPLFFFVVGAVQAFATVVKTNHMGGNWYIYSIEVNPVMPAVYWVRGYFEVDDAGNITAGTYYAPDGSTVK